MPELLTFRISVRPSPEMNDHEVVLLGDEQSLVRMFSTDLIGMDPDQILTEPCLLRATEVPHPVTIGRCVCGEVGCGSVEVDVWREGRYIEWRLPASDLSVRFAADQYDAELNRALMDFSWETPDRTAARLISRKTDRALLAQSGLSFSWASGQWRTGHMTASLMLNPGPYQVLVSLPWDGTAVEAIVDEFSKVLSAAPESWPNVEYLPQKQGLGVPHVKGANWRPWTPPSGKR